MRRFKSMMSIHEKGDDGDGEAEADGPGDLTELGDLAALLQGVIRYPVRIKCATLAWNTLLEALDEAA